MDCGIGKDRRDKLALIVQSGREYIVERRGFPRADAQLQVIRQFKGLVPESGRALAIKAGLNLGVSARRHEKTGTFLLEAGTPAKREGQWGGPAPENFVVTTLPGKTIRRDKSTPRGNQVWARG